MSHSAVWLHVPQQQLRLRQQPATRPWAAAVPGWAYAQRILVNFSSGRVVAATLG